MRLLGFLISAMLLSTGVAHAREITFSWEPFDNVYAYEIRISKTADFKQTLMRKGVKKPSFTVDLPIGRYFYKVRALDKSKRPGHWSDAVPFTITPYPPELVGPKTNSSYSFFEIPPEINFEWKPVDGDPEYKVLISKTTGQKISEEQTRDVKYTNKSLLEGDYTWRVRTIYQNVYESNYSEPKSFTIERKEFAPPVLEDPIKDKVVAAYRPVNFSWKNDPSMKFSDVQVTAKEGGASWNETNIKDNQQYSVPYMEPGSYSWTAKNKEGETTEGRTSAAESFQVRNDLVAAGNAYVSLGVAPSTYEVKTSGLEYVRSSLTYYMEAKYYPLESFGLSLGHQSSSLDRAPYKIPLQKLDAKLMIRGGVAGFAQEWFFGMRQMDMMLLDPVYNAGFYVTSGFVTGLSFHGTVTRGWRFLLSALYYKPTSATNDLGQVTADHYEIDLGASYNIFDQFWLSYKFRSEKTVANVADANFTLESSAFRTEWLHLLLSWEY